MYDMCTLPEVKHSHEPLFGDSGREFVKGHTKVDLAPESCICKAHQIEAKRIWGNPYYVLKWKSDQFQVSMQQSKCIVPEYQEVHTLISPQFDSIELVIGIKATPETPLLLCSKHYVGLHRQFKIRSCANCGAIPKQGTCFT